MTMQQDLLFAFGFGYCAEILGARLLADGWQVAGTVRSEEKAAALRAKGFDIRAWDGTGEVQVPEGAHWLVSIPPGALGCPAYVAASDQAGHARTLTYLSTTGVYGDLGGRWAAEWSPVNPQNERSVARVLAELQWHSLAAKLAIVRLPGIYGPGRSAFDRLREGTARRIVKPGQVFSRVHADDIASGLIARLARPDVRGVLHLCDDLPAPPQDVIAHAAGLLDMPVPPAEPFETAGLGDMAASFYAECKRVTNGRTKAALGWTPAYPTYREGLKAILKGEGPQVS